MKICSSCNEKKVYDEFHLDSSRNDGYRSMCKACAKAVSRQWHFDNRDKILCRQRKRYWENRDTELLRNAEYRKSNADKIQEYLKSERHRIVMRNVVSKRRALSSNTDITADWLMNLKSESDTCPLCSEQMNETYRDPKSKNLDHIVPINIGGPHTMDNVRIICQECNMKRPHNGEDVL